MTVKLPIVSSALLALTLLINGGCTTTARARELQSTAKTAPENAITTSRINDNNLRGIWDDSARIFFINRNSRLSPYIIP